jgi:hypothetical protein
VHRRSGKDSADYIHSLELQRSRSFDGLRRLWSEVWPNVIDKNFTDERHAGDHKSAPSKPMEDAGICLSFCGAQCSADRYHGCHHAEPVEEGTQGLQFASLRFTIARSVRHHLRENQYARNGGDIVEEVWLKWLWTQHR